MEERLQNSKSEGRLLSNKDGILRLGIRKLKPI